VSNEGRAFDDDLCAQQAVEWVAVVGRLEMIARNAREAIAVTAIANSSGSEEFRGLSSPGARTPADRDGTVSGDRFQ
jgi:hypothetical protein